MLGEVSYYLIDREFCLGLRGDGVLFFFFREKVTLRATEIFGFKSRGEKV